MTESFVNTFKRDYVARMDRRDVQTVLAQLLAAFEHFSEAHPQSALKMLIVPRPRKRRYASYLGEISPAPENIINRNLQSAVPKQEMAHGHHRVPDPGWQGVPLADIDCFDWMVVSWTIGTSPDAELVNTMLDAGH